MITRMSQPPNLGPRRLTVSTLHTTPDNTISREGTERRGDTAISRKEAIPHKKCTTRAQLIIRPIISGLAISENKFIRARRRASLPAPLGIIRAQAAVRTLEDQRATTHRQATFARSSIRARKSTVKTRTAPIKDTLYLVLRSCDPCETILFCPLEETDVGARARPVTWRFDTSEQVQILRGLNYAQAEGGAIKRTRLHKTMYENGTHSRGALPFARERERETRDRARRRSFVRSFVRQRTNERALFVRRVIL